MDKVLNIIIVEDHDSFSEALRYYLEKKLNHKVIFEAKSGAEFLEYPHKHRVDLVFMDIELPDINGIEITKKILEQFPLMKVLAMTMYEERVYLEEMILTGFKGALLKTSVYQNLEKAIAHVCDDKLFFQKDINIFKNL